jgi:hypothetical protein
MKNTLFAACAAFALAACGQAAAPVEEAPAAPQGLMEQAEYMSESDRLVFGYTQLVAYQQAHPEAAPPCTAPRATETRGIVPDTVADDSIYAAHKGSLVISVQCGQLVSRAAFDPREHWLVVFAPGATEAAVVNCAGPNGSDVCPRITAPAATPAVPTPAAP